MRLILSLSGVQDYLSHTIVYHLFKVHNRL